MRDPIRWSTEPVSIADNSKHLTQAMSQFIPMSVMDLKIGQKRHEYAHLVPLGDIVYADFSWGPRRLSRGPDGIGQHDEEYFALAAVHSGSETVTIGHQTHVLTTGDVVLWNCQVPTQITVSQSLHKSAILVPIRVLDAMSLRSKKREDFTFFTDAPTAPLMIQLLAYLRENLNPMSPAYRRMRNALLEMMLGIIEAHPNFTSAGLLPGLRSAVCRWIDDHLGDADLNPATIAAAHNVSVRTLHRAFQSESQTLAEVLRVRKLERACALLTDPSQTVTSVAYRLNFANPSHFSRVFTKHYSISPSEYRAEPTKRTLATPARSAC